MSDKPQTADELQRIAMISLNRELASFIRSIAENERPDFFHSMNRDLWQSEFGRFLQLRARSREFASND